MRLDIRLLLVLALAACCWAFTPARADEPPIDPEVRADAVAEAHAQGDATALAALAGQEQPDPWMVVFQLLQSERHDAAEAFAKAAPRKAVEALPAYVAARRKTGPDEEASAIFKVMKAAHEAADRQQELAAAAKLTMPPTSILGVLIVRTRATGFRDLRRFRESHADFLAAARAARTMGWLEQADSCAYLGGLSAAYGRDLHGARDAWLGRIQVARQLGKHEAVMITRLDVAGLRARTGQVAQALAEYVAVGKEATAAGLLMVAGNASSAAGSTYLALGRMREALGAFESAQAAYGKAGDKRSVARTRGNLGTVYLALGDYERVVESIESALAVLEAESNQAVLELPRIILSNQGNLALAYYRLARYADARDLCERLVPKFRALGDRTGEAKALVNLGSAYYGLRQHEKALAILTQARDLKLTLGDAIGARSASMNRGMALASLNRLEEAGEAYETLLASFAEAPDPQLEARCLSALTTLRTKQERYDEAVRHAQRGVRITFELGSELSATEAASRRDKYDGLFETGLLAAAQTGDLERAVWFLEQGRASTLRALIGNRDTLEEAVVPAELKTRLDAARAAARAAEDAYRRARRRRDLPRTKQGRDAWIAARERIRAVESSIQREAAAAASITLPEPASLESLRAGLDEHTALLLYGRAALAGPETARTIVVIVARQGARLVNLGHPAAIEAACEALQADDLGVETTKAVASLRALVIDPLALPASIHNVLVSAHGRLGYVPFALLLPQRRVSHAPSGTTLQMLASERAPPGTHVLALGDPHYDATSTSRSRMGTLKRLPRLPATRVEAERVGDTRLLGAEATKGKLVAALATRKRWRAIHLACHGLVNPTDPDLSALALTPSEEGGFLTCLDVFRLRTPADLVVLSACETGKGRIYRTEGIVGLARAFMFAGAPRVLCSLWKVDDAATQALMVKFYALWHPQHGGKGLAAAAALRAAQEHVRTQPKWKHPHYWAAWVLWGLPD